MGYSLNRLDEPVFMAGPKPMRTEFGIHQRLESCEPFLNLKRVIGNYLLTVHYSPSFAENIVFALFSLFWRYVLYLYFSSLKCMKFSDLVNSLYSK